MMTLSDEERSGLLQQLTDHGYNETQLDRLVELKDALLPTEVDIQKLLDAALKQNHDFSFITNNLPATIAHNVACIEKGLGISREAFIKAALKHPSLFIQSPYKLIENVTQSAELLHISRDVFIKAALQHPQLFGRSPQTLAGKVKSNAEQLDISEAEFVKAALKRPALLSQSPQKLLDNVTGSAALLGIEKATFVKAALKQPQLFAQSPKKLDENVTGSAERIGITKAEFVKAAVKQPSLFYRSPETMAEHAYYVKRIMHHLQDKRPLGEFIGQYPATLTLSNANMLGRAVLAHSGSYTRGAKYLITNETKADMQDALKAHYAGRVVRHKQTGEPLPANMQDRVLQTLHHIGALDKLPEGMEPLSDPRSLRMLERVTARKSAKGAEIER